MARVTVEDCLVHVPNRFALTVLAARRARALSEGKARPLVECENKEAVTALREVAAGKVRFVEEVDGVLREFIDETRHQYRVTSSGWGYVEAVNLGGLSEDDEGLLEEDDLEEVPSDPALLSQRAKAEMEGEDEAPEEGEDDEEGAVALEGEDGLDLGDVAVEDADDDQSEA